MDRFKQIVSKDGKHRLDIEVNSNGLFRFVTFDDRYRDDPDFQVPPEWTIVEFSGLYGSLEEIEADAVAMFEWLRD